MTNNIDLDYLKGSSDYVFEDGVDGEIVHDDGAMNISVGNMRYVFDIGQELSSSEYNRQANKIIKNANIDHKVSGKNN